MSDFKDKYNNKDYKRVKNEGVSFLINKEEEFVNDIIAMIVAFVLCIVSYYLIVKFEELVFYILIFIQIAVPPLFTYIAMRIINRLFRIENNHENHIYYNKSRLKILRFLFSGKESEGIDFDNISEIHFAFGRILPLNSRVCVIKTCDNEIFKIPIHRSNIENLESLFNYHEIKNKRIIGKDALIPLGVFVLMFLLTYMLTNIAEILILIN